MKPTAVTTYIWDSDNRMRAIDLPDGSQHTMSYRTDGIRYQLWDEEGDKRMVWDVPGHSGYGDLLQERLQ